MRWVECVVMYLTVFCFTAACLWMGWRLVRFVHHYWRGD